MAKRKHVHHGSKRKVKKVLDTPATGTVTVSTSSDVDLIQIATAGGSTTALTLDLGDVYAGQEIHLDIDSNIAGDTLVITLNGTASSVDIATAISANARNLFHIVVLDDEAGSEKGSAQQMNAAIT